MRPQPRRLSRARQLVLPEQGRGLSPALALSSTCPAGDEPPPYGEPWDRAETSPA